MEIIKRNPGNQNPRHSIVSGGIICRPHRGSFEVRDHLWANLGIISGLGIICGRGSFAALYITKSALLNKEKFPLSQPISIQFFFALHVIRKGKADNPELVSEINKQSVRKRKADKPELVRETKKQFLKENGRR